MHIAAGVGVDADPSTAGVAAALLAVGRGLLLLMLILCFMSRLSFGCHCSKHVRNYSRLPPSCGHDPNHLLHATRVRLSTWYTIY
jgi:hypothetical protein